MFPCSRNTTGVLKVLRKANKHSQKQAELVGSEPDVTKEKKQQAGSEGSDECLRQGKRSWNLICRVGRNMCNWLMQL